MEIAVTRPVTTCNAEMIVARLEHAGKTLLALPDKGFSPRLKTKRYDVVRSVAENYWGDAPNMRAPIPGSDDIAMMDEAIGWLDFIPVHLQSVRNVVRARMMVHPLNDRHLYSWRRIAREMASDHKTIIRKHEEGIKKIILGLAQTPQTNL